MHTIPVYFGHNPYPGRGILTGMSPSGKYAHIAYFIMGRSANSRNRVFVKTPDGIKTQACNPALLTDPSLIIYHPVRAYKNHLIVTNGDQTDTVLEFLRKGSTFEAALSTRAYEPDAPNFTPRISALVTFADGTFTYTLSILKAGAGGDCLRIYYPYAALPGSGRAIHTYASDGDPLPAFAGEPIEIEIPESSAGLADMLWSSLDPDNRVSLYVRTVDLTTLTYTERIINKHTEDNAK